MPPFFFYNHDDGRCAIVGGYAYRGERIPGAAGRVPLQRPVRRRGPGREPSATASEIGRRPLPVTVEGMVGFAEDANGELYVLSITTGVVARLDPG